MPSGSAIGEDQGGLCGRVIPFIVWCVVFSPGLPTEFEPAIAMTIREQVLCLRKVRAEYFKNNVHLLSMTLPQVAKL